MTAVHLTFSPSPSGHSYFDQMPDNQDQDWQRQYHQQMPAMNGQWVAHHGSQMRGISDLDWSIFEGGTAPDYMPYVGNGHIVSPNTSYVSERSLHSDVEMGTPSSGAFSNDPLEGYKQTQLAPESHLRPPKESLRGPGSTHSHRSSQGGISPRQHMDSQVETTCHDERPNISRSVTAPESGPHKSARLNSNVPALKRSGSEDTEDEYVPSGQPDNRGRRRQRQRIPHTAVERRYRENLNAHLDKLRQTVPSLASRRTSGGVKAFEGPGEGVKPSKCEILNGAIEHIGALDRENEALKGEVKELKTRIGDLESCLPGGGMFQTEGKEHRRDDLLHGVFDSHRPVLPVDMFGS